MTVSVGKSRSVTLSMCHFLIKEFIASRKDKRFIKNYVAILQFSAVDLIMLVGVEIDNYCHKLGSKTLLLCSMIAFDMKY